MLKFESVRAMLAWRAKFAPKSTILGKNGKYVLEKIDLVVGGSDERSNKGVDAVADLLEDGSSG